MDSKVYVDVEATFTKDGALFPKRFRWEDGQMYEIDRVTDCRRAASLKAGGVDGFEKALTEATSGTVPMQRVGEVFAAMKA